MGPAQQREGGDAREVASPLSAAEQAGLSKTKMGLSGPELGLRGRVKGVTEWIANSPKPRSRCGKKVKKKQEGGLL